MSLLPGKICHPISIGFREGDGMEARALSAPLPRRAGLCCYWGGGVWKAGTVEEEHRGVSRTSRDCTPALKRGQRMKGGSPGQAHRRCSINEYSKVFRWASMHTHVPTGLL